MNTSSPSKPRLQAHNLIAERWRELERSNSARWWQNVTQVLSVLAFALSLTTAFVSVWASRAKDLHDRQLQLALTIDKVHELMLKEAELSPADPQRKFAAGSAVGPLINGQVFSQMRRAYELARNLGSSATVSELRTVARFMTLAGNHSEAIALLRVAISASDSYLDQITSSDQLAHTLYRHVTSEEARSEAEMLFSRSIKIKIPDEEKHGPGASFVRAQTQYMWAEASASLNCANAKAHFAEAVKYLQMIGEEESTPPVNHLKQAVTFPPRMGFPGAKECKPDPLPGLEQKTLMRTEGSQAVLPQ